MKGISRLVLVKWFYDDLVFSHNTEFKKRGGLGSLEDANVVSMTNGSANNGEMDRILG